MKNKEELKERMQKVNKMAYQLMEELKGMEEDFPIEDLSVLEEELKHDPDFISAKTNMSFLFDQLADLMN